MNFFTSLVHVRQMIENLPTFIQDLENSLCGEDNLLIIDSSYPIGEKVFNSLKAAFPDGKIILMCDSTGHSFKGFYNLMNINPLIWKYMLNYKKELLAMRNDSLLLELDSDQSRDLVRREMVADTAVGYRMPELVSTLYSILTEEKGMLWFRSNGYSHQFMEIFFKPLCQTFPNVPCIEVNHERDLFRIPRFGFVFCDNFVDRPFEDKWITLDHNRVEYIRNKNTFFQDFIKVTSDVWMLKLNLFSARKMLRLGQQNISFLERMSPMINYKKEKSLNSSK